MDILCVGLMVCDIIAKPLDVSSFQMDSTRLDTLKIAPGGDSLNTSINMAKLGIDVGLVGRVGRDPLGDFLIKEADKYGVDISGICRDNNFFTSTSIVMVENNGERHFAYYGAANDCLSVGDVSLEQLRRNGVLHVGSSMALKGLDGKGLGELFEKASSMGIKTSMDVTWDSSGKWLEKIDDALYHTDIFMPSLNEARLIAGCDTPQEMRRFFEKYGVKLLAVKLGSEGCYVTNFEDEFFIETYRNVKVVDTTGAGDAFVSGFLAGICKGWGIYQCGVFANASASLCVTELGATAGTKTFAEILEFIKNNSIEEVRKMFT